MQETELSGSLFENAQSAFSQKTDSELRQAYRIFKSFNNPLLLKLGTGFTNLALKLRLPVEGIIRRTAFRQFCGGETPEECAGAISHLRQQGIFSAIQHSIETKSSEAEFVRVTEELLRAIEFARKNNNIKMVCCKPTGIADIYLLERLHKNPNASSDDAKAVERIRQRMDAMCKAASAAGVKLFFDAEETWIQNPLDELVNEMMARHNRQSPVVFNTFQLYAVRRLDALKNSFQKAKTGNYFLGAKLVRGAYMEMERERAHQHNTSSPVHPDKGATDNDYNLAIDFCVEHLDRIAFSASTHNEQSCLRLIHLINEKSIPRNHPHIFFSQLYGMGEHITYTLAKEGYNSVKLVPYGKVREVIPYLIRRAEENSSVAGQVGRELQILEKELRRRKLI